MKKWSQQSYSKRCNSIVNLLFLKQKKLLRKNRWSPSGDGCTELPMAKSFEVQTHKSEWQSAWNRYSWPNRHMKHVPGEQHCSNHRSANGLCLHKLLWGDDPSQKINTHTSAHSLPPPQWHTEDKMKDKARKLVDQRETTEQVKEWGDTLPPKQQATWSHSPPPTSVDTLQARTSMENTQHTPTPSFFYSQFLLPSKQS